MPTDTHRHMLTDTPTDMLIDTHKRMLTDTNTHAH